MTYATSGLIQAVDYNGFASTGNPNVNAIWSIGSGNSGYGQPGLTTVNPGQLILGTQFYNLIQAVQKSANHQGTTVGTFRNVDPAQGEIIFFEPNLANNIVLINNSRLNAATQGSTTTTDATSTVSWNNTLTITFTVTFASLNNARYFFNAGGQIGFNFFHPAGSGSNTTINNICSNAGTVWVSSPTSGSANLSGINYNGVTKIGGGDPANTSINANKGFYSFTPVASQLFQQGTAGYYYYYYGGPYLRISGSHNGNGVLTFTCLFNDVGGGPYYYYYGGVVSPGTKTSLILRPPSTTFLSNTWGTPAITSTIVAT